MGGIDELKEMIRELGRRNPVGFAEWVGKINLTDYQKKFMMDESKRIIFVASRQVGKSTCTALKAIRKAWCYEDQTILVISRTARQSQLLCEKIVNFINKEPIVKSDVVKANTEQVKFENGSVIYSLPGKSENVRGYSATMIIVDEAAFVPDEVFAAIEPALATTDGQLILISSPFRREGYFWRAWNSSGWSKHRVTCYENPLITEDFIEQFRQSHTLTEFRREMLAEFVDDDSECFVTADLLRRAMRIEKHYKPNPEYDYVIGVDFARFGNDKTCFAIVGKRKDEDMSNGVLVVVNIVLLEKKALTETARILFNLVREWKPLLVVCDSNGLGAGAFDMLREWLGSLVIDVKARQGIARTNMYLFVRDLLHDDRLLMFEDERIIGHFLNIDLSFDTGGRPKIVKRPGGNDDIADAIVYAVDGWVQIGFNSAKAEVCDFLNVDSIGCKIGDVGVRGLDVFGSYGLNVFRW